MSIKEFKDEWNRDKDFRFNFLNLIFWLFCKLLLIVIVVAGSVILANKFKEKENLNKATYEKEFCNSVNDYNYRIDKTYKIKSLISNNSTESTATGTMAFSIGYYTYSESENNYYSVYIIDEDGGIKSEKFPEKNTIFYEDIKEAETSYVEICTKSKGYGYQEEDLYRIHIPEGTIIEKIEVNQ